jgi:uncharacterized protein YggU (UPF0235/DUF167 family)
VLLSPRIVAVRVKPNSRQPRLEQAPSGGLVAYLKSPPIEGRANDELLARLAQHFGVPKSRLRLRSGAASRTKLVEILY